jgi:hypothetical protein
MAAFTEERWLAADSFFGMWYCLRDDLKMPRTKNGRRRLRLYACASCRRLWHLFPDERPRRLVEVAERFADGQAGKEELAAAYDAVTPLTLGSYDEGDPGMRQRMLARAAQATAKGDTWMAAHGGYSALCGVTGLHTPENEQTRPACLLFLEVFGNPFRPATLSPALKRWRDGTLPKMAQAIYDEGVFDRVPILADALEDAGGDDAALLEHCRSRDDHYRGCWAIDLLRGLS